MRYCFLRLIPLLLCAVVVHGVVRSQSVDARAWVDSTSYLIGDPITVHVDVSYRKAASFKMFVGDTVDGFHVLDRQPFQQIADTLASARLVIAKYDSGRAIFPGVPILYSVPGDTAPHTATTNPLLLTISTVPVDTTKEIKDVKPPLSISLTLAEIAIYLGIILLLSAVGYLVYRYWKKRQAKKTGYVYVPPPRPAHMMALEDLAILKEKKLWQQGLIKEYYTEGTEIIRRYFGRRYGFMALEQTTDEIMGDLGKYVRTPDVLSQTEGLLRRADLVKFAKYRPGIPEHEKLMSDALEIVDKTTPTTRPVATDMTEAEPVHVES